MPALLRPIPFASALVLALVLTLVLTQTACSREEQKQPVPPPASSAPSDPAASAPATTPPAASSAVANAAPPIKPAPSSAAAPLDAAVECGQKGQPECPMQAWMKRNASAPSRTGDLPALAAALDQIAAMAPAGYEAGYGNWVSISKDGAAAARAGDLDATKASCTACHKQYRAKYKSELRARAVP